MLNVDKLSFSYGSHKRLLRDISFQLNPSEIIRLKGSNGKGKSTLIKCLLGLLSIDSGEVCLNERYDLNYFRLNSEYLAPEENALFNDLSALENLRVWSELNGQTFDKPALIKGLSDWGFKGDFLVENLPVSKFSTGMKRRLALVRLSLSSAKLWLLDEPLYGLDIAGVNQFAALLDTHLKSGGMAVIISHDESIFTSSQNLPTRTIEL